MLCCCVSEWISELKLKVQPRYRSWGDGILVSSLIRKTIEVGDQT